MKRRTILKILAATTAFCATLLCGCDLSKNTSQIEVSSIEQSDFPEQPCVHVFGEWTVIDEPSCDHYGYETRTCTLCNELEDRNVAMLEHIPGEWVVHSTADCLNDGISVQSCTRCYNQLDIKTTPKLTTHELTVTSVDRKPTCTVVGYVQKHCACHEVVTNTFSPSLGGHIDENGDLLCDTCEEKLRSIPVYLKLQGNAKATAADHVFIGEESGGIISVTMGENSIFYQHYTHYPALSDDPDYLDGNVVYSRPHTIMPWELNSLTTTYHHHITADNLIFGKPREITLEIADTTQTGLVVLEQFSVPSEKNQKNFTQVLLFWGELSTQITVAGTDNEYLSVCYYTDMDGNVLSNEKTVDVVLTQPITHLRVYYQDLNNA